MNRIVTCLMATYQRPPKSVLVVEEAIESFLQQRYPHKELIIVNDCPEQTLRLDRSYPGVTLINLPVRFRSLGEKLNFAAAMGRGSYLARWDDDDISLPWRLDLSIARRPKAADYWKPTLCWDFHGGDFRSLKAGFFSHFICDAEAFHDAGGFPHVSDYDDQAIEAVFEKRGASRTFDVLPEETFYLYRWGDGSTHVSGFSGGNGYAKLAQPGVPGEFIVRPRWTRDYVREAYLAAIALTPRRLR